ncbi:hypothetical protein ACFQJ7_10705 [Halovenus rubra]|uniref:Uncharacterized protein n=2 Tax=Halovenus rubra TaxID=869890 RepID=A0ABD5X9L9_9EURY|nr:hypothetical protein [Halovenus rubra]
MPIMSSEDFSVHADDCDEVGDGMPISDLPDEITSIEDLECQCWDEYETLAEI